MSATPDKKKPGTSDKPDNVKPDGAKPDGAKPDGTKPDTAKPGETDGGATPTPEESAAGEEAAVDGIASVVETAPGVETPLGTDAAPMPQIALVLKAIDQKELREFHAEYSSSTAVQRTYRPQGFFGLSPAVLARLPAGAFIEVDTDDEFWRMYEVNVHGPSATDYGAMGLRSAAVQIDYNAADRRKRVTRTLEFIKGVDSGGASKPFSTPMAPGVYHYDTTVTYAFDDSWTGDPRPRSVDVPSSTLRTVYVVPQQDFRFVVVNASFASPPDWTEMSQIHAQLVCRSTSATLPEEFVRDVVIHEGWMPSLLPAAEQAGSLPWRVRFKDPTAPVEITCRLSYITRKGQRHDADPIVTGNPNLVFRPSP